MDYKKLMGYGNKPKKINKKKKPSLTENLMKEFGHLEKGRVYTDKDLPPFKSSKQQVNEGPSYEYANYIKKIEKAEKQHGKEVNNLVKLLKKKGMNKEATQLESNYKINVKRDFMKFLEYLYGTLT